VICAKAFALNSSADTPNADFSFQFMALSSQKIPDARSRTRDLSGQ
jgi:hypothetical protein